MFKNLKGLQEMAETLKQVNGLSKKSPEEIIKSMGNLGIDTTMMEDINKIKMSDFNQDNPKMIVEFVNKSEHESPMYQHDDDSGFDLRANIPGDKLTLKPLDRMAVPTGLHFGLPEGYELQIRPRSGLAYNHGITVLNTPGTVDRGYTGEVKIILINLSKEDFVINDGDRIAQGVINGILTQRWADFTRVDELSETSRSDGGFGSTGKQ
jgi:dUTP pyrophosphatase